MLSHSWLLEVLGVLFHYAQSALVLHKNFRGEKTPYGWRAGTACVIQPLAASKEMVLRAEKCLLCCFSWCYLSNLKYIPTWEIFWGYSWLSESDKYLKWLGEACHKNSDSTSREKRDLFWLTTGSAGQFRSSCIPLMGVLGANNTCLFPFCLISVIHKQNK